MSISLPKKSTCRVTITEFYILQSIDLTVRISSVPSDENSSEEKKQQNSHRIRTQTRHYRGLHTGQN
eukprot:13300851-Ditylum_brightwellii.AAC.1